MGKEPTRAFRLVDEITPTDPPCSIKTKAKAQTEVSSVRSVACKKTSNGSFPKAAGVRASEDDGTTGGESDPLTAAVNRALSMLEYGDMSRRRLLRKLTDRGIPPDVATQAVDVLEIRGYLRETDACRRRAEQGLRKGWGSRRIAEDLYAQRYPRSLVEAAMAALEDEVDFTAQCVAVLRKKYHTVPDDRDDRRRMIAALARLGYGMEEIRAAMQAVVAEEGDGAGD